MNRIELVSLGAKVNVFDSMLFIVKYCICEYGMIFTLDINSNDGIKRVYGILLFNH